MTTLITTTPNPGPNPGSPDAAPLRSLSITTAINHDFQSSVSSPASAVSASNVSTPTSSCSIAPPVAIRPSTSNQLPLAGALAATRSMAGSTAMSPALISQARGLSMTSKEWVIPPRPKPGRKPATDTPPTKRKAQNRAAQRAFRERRAARVGELEEQLDEDKLFHDRLVRKLQERISHLETETQTLQLRCQWLESALEKERQGRGSTTGNWNSPQQHGAARDDGLMSTQMQGQQVGPSQQTPSRNAAARSIPIAEPRPLAQPLSISQIVSPPEEATPVDLGCGGCQVNGSCACAEEVLRSTDLSMGCGRCSLGTRCECLEESLRASMAGSDLKRPLPPSSPPSTSPEEKRQRSSAGIVMETDFTAMFASQSTGEAAQPIFPPSTHSQLQPLQSIEPRDSCGFCKDGTYCVCADSMMTSASLPAPVNQQTTEQTQTHTPPPSDNDVVVIPMPMEVTATGAIKLPVPRTLQQQRPTNRPPAKTGGCGPNGPGTCAQCLVDPKSGLFCRSLAANFDKNNPASGGGGCCGNGGPGGCCKSGPTQPEAAVAAIPSGRPTAATVTTTTAAGGPLNPGGGGFGLSLSCADAYKTLASHRHFDEAADDIGSWLPKLKALPVLPRPGPVRGRGGGGRDARAPIEVEAASIMSVLKDFDVRFGRGE
ncbi:hypothetical protein C8A00DRAFT_46519 [Chaetomidium leptoderma]|uniref:BZIP domain-containing protein n=1 Tax=Chaetomidium leptoderma TaxID=669021 RepID=A0AAN6ZV46_9PEZI|nr:hypothetical protein C8A00DRAFT_46519 [Chaetomidium leptoderma]